MIAGAQIGLGFCIARDVEAVEMHRPAGEDTLKPLSGLGLGPLAQRREKGGDDLGQRPALAADQPTFVQKRRAEHRFQRPHEAPLFALDQRRGRRLPDQHRSTLWKEDRRGERLALPFDPQSADAAVL